MLDYSKKSKEHLFLIFLLGGMIGTVDRGSFEMDGFIGGGLGMMFIAMALGYILNLLIPSSGIDREAQMDSEVLDAELEDEKSLALKERIKMKMRPFKFGLYVALIFFVLVLFGQLERYFF